MVHRKTRNTLSLLLVLVAAAALVLPSPVVEGMPREGGQTAVAKAPPSLTPLTLLERLLEWLELEPEEGADDGSALAPADSQESSPAEPTPQIGPDMDPNG